MEPGELWDEFSSLPADAQRQVVEFIAFLRQRSTHVRRSKSPRRRPLASEAFVGMWRDRAELEDSSDWVTGVRKREWGESGG